MTDRANRYRFFRFLLSGGLAATINIGSRYELSGLIGFRAAVLAAFCFGVSSAWILSRLWVFGPSQRHWATEFGRFLTVNLVALPQTWIISVLLAEWALPAMGVTQGAELAGHVIGVIFPVFTSYLAHKHFSFAGANPLSQDLE